MFESILCSRSEFLIVFGCIVSKAACMSRNMPSTDLLLNMYFSMKFTVAEIAVSVLFFFWKPCWFGCNGLSMSVRLTWLTINFSRAFIR